MTNVVPGRLYEDHQGLKQIVKGVNDTRLTNMLVKGLTGSSVSCLISSAWNQLQTTHLVIAGDKEEAAYLQNDLVSLTGSQEIFFFPSAYKRSIRYGQKEPSNMVLRTSALNFLASGKRKCIIVTWPEAMMELVAGRNKLKDNSLRVQAGDKLSIEFMEELFVEYRFNRVDFVYEPGQYSVRGSLVDIFSYSSDLPYRIDFFGETVESIRTFNPEDQLSVEKVKEMYIVPNIQDAGLTDVTDPVTSFLPPSAVVWIDDAVLLKQAVDHVNHSEWVDEGEVRTEDKKLTAESGRLIKNLASFNLIELTNSGLFKHDISITFSTEPQPVFNKNFDLLGERLVGNREAGITNIIISESESQIKRLRDIFSEVRADAGFIPMNINLHRGFTDKDLSISIFTDHQIFDRYHKFRIKGLFSHKERLTMRELTGLNPGDWVVHSDHGIGRFGGLETIEINGRKQEALKLVYKNNDTLFVGIHALHRISKYKGKEAEEPRLAKLGSGAWQKIKNNTKRRVKDIARDLILLYAKRTSVPGFSFSPDTYLQTELEASFIYEDTPDQLAASNSVKEDMQKKFPMDRLICGDVGFGKTEVAVRAAFKAATDNKQTAVLVPTTILALQHYQTFSDRLRGMPVNIDYLSRHRTASEQRRIIEDLTSGKTDIIIGTHKLVGKQVAFKDLGLLIIDEEQRFGVAVKEQLKRLRADVDTLTMTATPIPRTLQFSLMGARDLSIINTPPPNRMPIITELHGFNEDIIKEGIEYEVSRNGQVFFIHNRVDNIGEVKGMIERIVPGIKCDVVHGQMEGKKIENIMFDFVHGDYDLLIATTIIESGLDIPNANTIFINNAHQFGLSELHQLRGRVGRSNKKAFCYLLTPPPNMMTRDARRRLKAVEEFSDLGSGFNIAMQDLDIRGAGNLLGGEQSGFIADVGFETYQRILREAVDELKSEEFSGLFEGKESGESKGDATIRSYVDDCHIDTDLEIMFPESYISSISERMRLYRQLNGITEEAALGRFEGEVTDRFGPLPDQARELFNVVRMRKVAIKMGIERLVLKKGLMICQFVSDPDSSFYSDPLFGSLLKFVASKGSRYRVKHSEEKFSVNIKNVTTIMEATEVIKEMKSCQQV